MENNINKIIKTLLSDYKEEKIKEEDVVAKIKDIYFEDIGFAKVDHHRILRRGFPEVIYGTGKTPEQIKKIAMRMLRYTPVILITKTSIEVYNSIKKEIKSLLFDSESGIIYTDPDIDESKLYKGITLISAGTSDIKIAGEAAITCYLMGNKVNKIYDVGVAGIHRLINFKDDLKNSNIIIAVAGMEGTLPGIISSMVNCPVIGVPTSSGYGANFGGISPMLTMLNSCSPGVTVVNIDNGFGAGYSASIINRLIMGKKIN
jgi:pyridinium-3,5-biscarboxylic acid mononucleotide synthase